MQNKLFLIGSIQKKQYENNHFDRKEIYTVNTDPKRNLNPNNQIIKIEYLRRKLNQDHISSLSKNNSTD